MATVIDTTKDSAEIVNNNLQGVRQSVQLLAEIRARQQEMQMRKYQVAAEYAKANMAPPPGLLDNAPLPSQQGMFSGVTNAVQGAGQRIGSLFGINQPQTQLPSQTQRVQQPTGGMLPSQQGYKDPLSMTRPEFIQYGIQQAKNRGVNYLNPQVAGDEFGKQWDAAQTSALKPEERQDKLENQYSDRLSKIISFRSGGLGLQDSKVNQAIDLRTMVDQYYDPKTDTYSIPPSMHTELVLGLARLLSPTGQIGIELEDALRQKTAKEGVAKTLIYLGADPRKVGGTTQSVMKTFIESVDRQGKTAEKLRDQYITGIKGLVPSGLDDKTVERLNKANLSSSFNDYLKNSQEGHSTFVVGGKTYQVPKDQVEAFKKKAGLK